MGGSQAKSVGQLDGVHRGGANKHLVINGDINESDESHLVNENNSNRSSTERSTVSHRRKSDVVTEEYALHVEDGSLSTSSGSRVQRSVGSYICCAGPSSCCPDSRTRIKFQSRRYSNSCKPPQVELRRYVSKSDVIGQRLTNGRHSEGLSLIENSSQRESLNREIVVVPEKQRNGLSIEVQPLEIIENLTSKPQTLTEEVVVLGEPSLLCHEEPEKRVVAAESKASRRFKIVEWVRRSRLWSNDRSSRKEQETGTRTDITTELKRLERDELLLDRNCNRDCCDNLSDLNINTSNRHALTSNRHSLDDPVEQYISADLDHINTSRYLSADIASSSHPNSSSNPPTSEQLYSTDVPINNNLPAFSHRISNGTNDSTRQRAPLAKLDSFDTRSLCSDLAYEDLISLNSDDLMLGSDPSLPTSTAQTPGSETSIPSFPPHPAGRRRKSSGRRSISSRRRSFPPSTKLYTCLSESQLSRGGNGEGLVNKVTSSPHTGLSGDEKRGGEGMRGGDGRGEERDVLSHLVSHSSQHRVCVGSVTGRKNRPSSLPSTLTRQGNKCVDIRPSTLTREVNRCVSVRVDGVSAMYGSTTCSDMVMIDRGTLDDMLTDLSACKAMLHLLQTLLTTSPGGSIDMTLLYSEIQSRDAIIADLRQQLSQYEGNHSESSAVGSLMGSRSATGTGSITGSRPEIGTVNHGTAVQG